MARMIQATPIGMRSFSNKDNTKWYYIVYVTFEEEGTDGLAAVSVFVSDTDYAVIQSRFGDPMFSIDVFKSGNRWDYILR